MGVKSTVELTRKEAEEKAAELYSKQRMGRYYHMSDVDLEDLIESWNDEVHGGEGFENYRIRG
jgi:hypothetical protein